MELFSLLSDYNLIDDYAKIFDWIFNDNMFPALIWDNKNKVQAFTKALHKLDKLSPDNIHYDAKERLAFPERSNVYSCIYMAKGSSEGRDWLRHIRNAIAHGKVNVVYKTDACMSGILLELRDYGKAETGEGGQTAYMLIPLEYLADIYKVYLEKEKQWKRAKSKKERKV